jgi:hypothetical protein
MSAMLSAGVAEIADPQRFRRGRAYRRDDAVVSLDVEPGVVSGGVQGSRPTPYNVEVRVGPGPAGVSGAALVPSAKTLRISCTCPDWDDPCKHAIAVLLEFADRVGDNPELLATWRSGSTVAPVPPETRSSSAATGPDTSTEVTGSPLLDPFFLGGPVLGERSSPLSVLAGVGRGRLLVGDVDLGVIIDNATNTVASAIASSRRRS